MKSLKVICANMFMLSTLMVGIHSSLAANRFEYHSVHSPRRSSRQEQRFSPCFLFIIGFPVPSKVLFILYHFRQHFTSQQHLMVFNYFLKKYWLTFRETIYNLHVRNILLFKQENISNVFFSYFFEFSIQSISQNQPNMNSIYILANKDLRVSSRSASNLLVICKTQSRPGFPNVGDINHRWTVSPVGRAMSNLIKMISNQKCW